MRGFILAAGFGTRLRPITNHIPKALVPVCGKPLIERSLSFCARQGIAGIGVNAHYMADKLAAYRDRSPFAFSLFHERDTIRGTGGALYFAREFLAGDEVFFVCNVDIVCRLDIGPILEGFLRTGWLGCLIATPAGSDGTIYYDQQTLEYRGVPADGERPEGANGAAFIGAALYRRQFLDLLTNDDFSVVPVWRRAAMRESGIGVSVVSTCFWRDIGTPSALAGIHFELLDGTATLDIPDCLFVDGGGKRCYHRDLPSSLRNCIGRHAWVETPLVPEASAIERSVVFADARLRAESAGVKNRIITSFGEVPID